MFIRSVITLAENFGKWRPYLELFFFGGGGTGRAKISLGWPPAPLEPPLLIPLPNTTLYLQACGVTAVPKLQLATSVHMTRENFLKLAIFRPKHDTSKYSFTVKSVKVGNSLPNHVSQVSKQF